MEEKEKERAGRDCLVKQKYHDIFKTCSVIIEKRVVENQISFIILRVFLMQNIYLFWSFHRSLDVTKYLIFTFF